MVPSDGHWLNQRRLEIYPRITVVLFIVITVTILLQWFIGNNTAHLPITDFSVYWITSYLALHGQSLSVFDPATFCRNFQPLVPTSTCGYQWLYPPSFYLLIFPLALLPYWLAYLMFMGVSVGGFVLMMRRLITGRIAMVCLAAFPGLWINVLSGQNGCLTAALAGTALLNLERRPILSGVFVGFLSIKPHLALLFPVALVAARAWRTLFVATGVATAWMMFSMVVLGTGVLEGWINNFRIARAILEWTETIRMMPTVFSLLRLSGSSTMVAYMGQIVIAVMTFTSVWTLWRRNIPPTLKYAALVTGNLLMSPYLLEYDLVWLALPIAWLTQLGLKTGWLRWEREVLVTAWVTPILCIALSSVLHLQIGVGVLLALLWVIVRRASASNTRQSAAL